MTESKARAALREFARSGQPPLAASPAEAASLAAAAECQGLAELLLGALERVGRAEDDALVVALAPRRAQRLAAAIGQLALAARALEQLAGEGLRALPLKGAALASTVYDLESERPMGDIDLLALDGHGEAVRALVAAGLEAVAAADHARVFREPVSGRLIELHHSVTSAPGLFPVDGEGVWARRRAGRGLLPVLPSAEDLLVQLALHASFQHGLVVSLVQWLDFRRLLERETLDLDRVAELASRARAEAPLAAALLAAHAVVGAPLDARLLESTERALPRGLRSWLAPRLERPLELVAGAREALARARWELLAGRRPALLLRTLLPAAPADERRLPSRLAQALARAGRLGLATLRGRLPAARTPAAPTASAPAASLRGEPRPDTAEQALLRGCVASFPAVRLRVSGHCMEPALRPGEQVQLVPASRQRPRVGDVVLVRQGDGVRLHRLVWAPSWRTRRPPWRTRADRGVLLDPPLGPEDLLATVTAVAGRPAARSRCRALVSLVEGALAGVAWRRASRKSYPSRACAASCAPAGPAAPHVPPR